MQTEISLIENVLAQELDILWVKHFNFVRNAPQNIIYENCFSMYINKQKECNASNAPNAKPT